MEISYEKGKALSILLFVMDIMPMVLLALLPLEMFEFTVIFLLYGCVPLMILSAILHWRYQKRLDWPIQVTCLSRLLRCFDLLPALFSCCLIAFVLNVA